ncbi:hypothetical protein [Phenylobacterium immobile]|uniref:hypothetical protein n=1 Tax=Phenylobacterium immobile TaxID=21 RepID=UPI000B897840|nr:hypothetical protein [Phenylobacterium immobile]
MKSARKSSDRANPWYGVVAFVLVAAVCFMGWSLVSRSQRAVDGAVLALNSARTPDFPLPVLPGSPPTIPETPIPTPR